MVSLASCQETTIKEGRELVIVGSWVVASFGYSGSRKLDSRPGDCRDRALALALVILTTTWLHCRRVIGILWLKTAAHDMGKSGKSKKRKSRPAEVSDQDFRPDADDFEDGAEDDGSAVPKVASRRLGKDAERTEIEDKYGSKVRENALCFFPTD